MKNKEKYFNIILFIIVVVLLFNDVLIYKYSKTNFNFKINEINDLYDSNNDAFQILQDLKIEFNSQISDKYCSPVPSNLNGGRIKINQLPTNFSSTSNDIQLNLNSYVNKDGRWQPVDCKARHRVAIIIPYKDRLNNLNSFLNHMHPFLQRQELEYQIFVVEQSNEQLFNKGILMNSGFLEIMSLSGFKTQLNKITNVKLPFDCVIFHDVDLLPEGIYFILILFLKSLAFSKRSLKSPLFILKKLRFRAVT